MNKFNSDDKNLLQAKELLGNMLALLNEEERQALLKNLLNLTKEV